MNVLTNDTAIKLMCCADAFDAMLTKGEMPTADNVRLAVGAMREAIPKVESTTPVEPESIGATAAWLKGLGLDDVDERPEFPAQNFKQRIAELASQFGEAMRVSKGSMPYRDVYESLRRLPHILDDIARNEAWLNEARIKAVAP